MHKKTDTFRNKNIDCKRPHFAKLLPKQASFPVAIFDIIWFRQLLDHC